MTGYFNKCSGLASEHELIEQATRTMLRNDIAMEELTLAIEGLDTSEAGRLFARDILCDVDGVLAFEMMGRGASEATLARLHRQAIAGMLAIRFAEAVATRRADAAPVVREALEAVLPGR
jgi:hypothetical protein